MARHRFAFNELPESVRRSWISRVSSSEGSPVRVEPASEGGVTALFYLALSAILYWVFLVLVLADGFGRWNLVSSYQSIDQLPLYWIAGTL